MPRKRVTVVFIYEEKRGKDDDYYRNLAFEEIYNTDDVLDSSSFGIEDID